MITVNEIRLPLGSDKKEAIRQAIKLLKISDSDVKFADISRISVDARRSVPSLVYTVAVTLNTEGAQQAFVGFAPRVKVVTPHAFIMPTVKNQPAKRPVVCGFGPSGIFCALALAKAGLRPIVLEKGPPINERVKAVKNFELTGVLDEGANIQFGEGGAGTFSDGKLTTRINSPLCNHITELLVENGAPKSIQFLQNPHIGTDLLRGVIVSLRKQIESLGGTVIFNSPVTEFVVKDGAINAVKTNDATYECDSLALCIGHSSRDTFEALQKSGFGLVAKPFSVGFRAEHLQQNIDEALYGSAAGHPDLPTGEYKMSCRANGRGVYTFCMCPGGSVVAAASEHGGVVTNGMSLHARDGKNANAAVVVGVTPDDFSGDAMKAIEFQRELEKKAFIAGGKTYCAPAQNATSFIEGKIRLDISSVVPTYPLGTAACNLAELLPEELSRPLQTGMKIFGAKCAVMHTTALF